MVAAQLKLTQQAACEKSEGCNIERALESMIAFQNAMDSPLVQIQGSPLSCRLVTAIISLINGLQLIGVGCKWAKPTKMFPL